MRHKILFLIFFGICLAESSLFAQHVTEEQAYQKAQAFLQDKIDTATGSRRALHRMQRVSKAVESDAFYIFNAEDNGGFVIVSGDERLPAVLGYSLTGCYDPENVPVNMQSWLEGYAAQVKFVQTHDNSRSIGRRSLTGSAISPLLDCEWDQWEPYNSQCPDIWGTQAPTGCVATAMAQIMYYYQWPQQTRKQVPGYPIYDDGWYIGITVSEIPVTNINWDNMIPRYVGNYSTEQSGAIAQLMQLCGTSIRTKFDTGESMATMTKVIKAFPRYFGYSTDISLVYAADYESDDWSQLMYDELAASRPIMYSGLGESGGHSFVVDGYDDNDYFHINWGWGGSDNGYFLLSALLDFNTDQCAVIGIQPSATSIPDAYGVLEDGTMTLYYDTKMNERSGQIFDDLVSYDFFAYQPMETEVLRCPPEESMIECVIDPSFANCDLETLDYFFYDCSNLKTITGLKYLNTSHVKDMVEMFYRCSSLETIDFEDFQTGNVKDMAWMFRECTSLKELDLSGFNTENVIAMNGMFYHCSSLEMLDLKGFNTENVESMNFMFEGCSALEELDLSSFNTQNNYGMYSMFEGCSSLTNLDVSSFNTEKVQDMAYTFRYCSSLKSLNLDNFNTENVTQMVAMFEGCTALESLDLSSFNTEKVGSMWDMFLLCYSLKTLDVSSFNTSNVSGSMGQMFSNCLALESLDLSGFHTENVTDMSCMFACCSSLNSLDVSSFDTSNVTDMRGMFSGCHSLTSLDVSNFKTDNLVNIVGMFQGCSTLDNLDLSSFNTSHISNMETIFADCTSLNKIIFGNEWNTDNVTSMGMMFISCESLKALDLSRFNTEKVTNMFSMFASCYSLTSLDVSGFNTSNVTDMNRMFASCQSMENINFGTKWNTDKVTSMYQMFMDCQSLRTLDVSKFNTSNVTDMNRFFAICRSLKTIYFGDEFSTFNTENVTNMESMFWDCQSLTSLDISIFNTSNVNNMTSLFAECGSLESIIVGDKWNTENVDDGSDAFLQCYKIVGQKGTTYNEEHIDMDYAHVDGGLDNPGYLTLKVANILLGDVNGNGGIDIGDAVCIVNYLVDKENLTFIEEAADTNKNGKIDIGDAVTIVNYLVGKTASLSRKVDTEWDEREPQ